MLKIFKNMNKRYIIAISSISLFCILLLVGYFTTTNFMSNNDKSRFQSSIDNKNIFGNKNNTDNKNNKKSEEEKKDDNQEEKKDENSSEEKKDDNLSPSDQMMDKENNKQNSNKPNQSNPINNNQAVTPPSTNPNTQQPSGPNVPVSTGDTRGVWISYIELDTILKGKNAQTFTNNINQVFQNVRDLGLNTVYVHVHPFSDSIYPSNIFPWSYYASGQHGKDPGFDPLAIIVNRAHAYGLKIHAWFNPYRVSGSFSMSQNNPTNWGNHMTLNVGGKISLDPSENDAINKVVEAVKEVVRNYNVDGIQFDDYFYPTSDMGVDLHKYEAYKNAGGSLSQADWRRENVDKLVRATYSAVKSIKGHVKFGISPQGNNSNNFNSQFANVTKWVQNSGYVDYIAPQIYWGFNHKSAAFMSKVNEWTNLVTSPSVELIFGLAHYRAGTIDNYAGNGKNEWQESTDIIARQIVEINKNPKIKGFILFSYKSLFMSNNNSHAVAERENIRNVLRS